MANYIKSVLLISAVILSVRAGDMNPVQVSTWPGFIRGPAKAVASSGEHVYAQVGERGFVVFDVRSADNPVPVGSLQTSMEIRSIFIRGAYAYIMGSAGRSEIVDIGNSSAPRSVRTNNWGGEISFLGHHAYGAHRANSFDVFDVSDPTDPKRLRSVVSRNAGRVAIAQDIGYVYHPDRIEVMDLTDPSNPITISDYPVSNGILKALNTYSNYVLIAVTEDRALPPYYSYFEVIDLQNPHEGSVVARLPISPWPTRLEVFGDRAYVTTAAGLEVFDLANPLDPKPVASYSTSSEPFITVLQGRGFVGDGSAGLVMVDLAATNLPSMGSYRSTASAEAIEVIDGLAYLADGAGGLRILDVKNPLDPRLVGEARTITNATGVAYASGHAYVEEQGFGLEIFDVRNPSSPNAVSSYPVEYAFHSVLSEGNLVIATDAGLEIVSVTDPTNPRRIGWVHLPGSTKGLLVTGQHAYLAGHYSTEGQTRSGIRAIDISRPSTPILRDFVPSETPYGLAGSDTHLFVSGDGLSVYDLTDRSSPAFKTRYPGPGYAPLVMRGNHLFARGYVPMGVIDVTDPLKAELVGSFPAWGDVVERGQYTYVADSTAGLRIFDASKPAIPVRSGSWALTNELFSLSYQGSSVTVSSNHAYVIDGKGDLQVIDVSNRQNPFRTNVVERAAGIDRGIEAIADVLYVGDYLRPANLFAISNPASPKRVGTFGSDVSIIRGSWGRAAAISFEAYKVQLVDVQNPSVPVLITNYPATQILSSVTLRSNVLYLGFRYGSIQTVDITHPLAPVWGGVVSNLGGDVRGIAAVERRFYVVAGDAMKVLDYTNPQQPAVVGSVPIAGARSVVVIGDNAYVAGSLATYVIDISSPSAPRLIGANSAVIAEELAVTAGTIYAVGYFNTLSVLDPYIAPIQELRFSALTFSETGAAQFLVSGSEGDRVRIERASDLSESWGVISTVTLTNSTVTITDDQLPGATMFYRASVLD